MSVSGTTRAILLNLGVFLVDSNVRRSTGSYSFNYTSNSGNTTRDFVTVSEGGGTYTWLTPSGMNPSLLTQVVTSGRVTASITLRNAATFNVNVNQLLLIDDDVQQVVFTNNGSSPVRVELQQI